MLVSYGHGVELYGHHVGIRGGIWPLVGERYHPVEDENKMLGSAFKNQE